MDLTYATLAVMVTDRRRASESFALGRRLLRRRRTELTVPTTPARLPVATDRTTVAPTPKAA